jgi:hypothetical protein
VEGAFHGHASKRSDPVAELKTMRQNTTTPADHPVFVAHDGRRARRLRHAAVVVGVLAALWIVGLGVGMLGFGSLPGVALVKGARKDSRPAQAPAAPAPAAGDRAAGRLLSADMSSIRSDRSGTAGVRRSANGSSTRHSARTARRASHAPATTPAATTPAPVNPAQRTRGWARKGYAAPRGQLRKAAPPPPPASSGGRRVGQTNTPPAVSPGQAKKALDPPPPPPPPKKG